jgi:BON domain
MSRSAVCMAIGFVGLSAALSAQEEPRAVQEIRRELARLPQYSVFDLVAFDYEKGMVTLGGYVTDPSLKRAAEKAVQHIEGVERATNTIEVLPNSISDDDLRWEVYRAIYRDSPLSRYGDADDALGASRTRSSGWGRDRAFPGMEPVGPKAIHIIVNRGNVILAGVVDSTQDKQLAELKARGVFGVRKVVNDLEVAGRAD